MEQMNAFLMPSENLERGPIKIITILSCQISSKENIGFSFKIEADATEDGEVLIFAFKCLSIEVINLLFFK